MNSWRSPPVLNIFAGDKSCVEIPSSFKEYIQLQERKEKPLQPWTLKLPYRSQMSLMQFLNTSVSPLIMRIYCWNGAQRALFRCIGNNLLTLQLVAPIPLTDLSAWVNCCSAELLTTQGTPWREWSEHKARRKNPFPKLTLWFPASKMCKFLKPFCKWNLRYHY